MNKIKIIEVINSLEYRGGAQVFFVDLCSQLKKNENVDLLVIVLYSNYDQSLINKLLENGIKVATCNKRKSIDFRSFKTFKKLIKKFQPNIIHFHLSFYLTYFMSFGLRRRKWKLVKTYHSVPSAMTKLDKVFEKLYLKKRILSLIGISKIISEEIKEIHSGKCDPFTIYNGIEICPIRNYAKDFDFIIVASMTPVKNHKLLFDAFSEFIKKYPDAKLLCVGGGELLSSHKKYIEDLGLQEKVCFTGPVDNVQDYLAQSKTLVLSSKYEGNPICILEAMSFGLQIVAPRVGGIPDIVCDNENGYLFETLNKEDLNNCLEKAYLATRESIIRNNNLNKIKAYSIEETSKQYLSTFEDILNK